MKRLVYAFALLAALAAPASGQSGLFRTHWWLSIDQKTDFPKLIWRLDTVRLRAELRDTAAARSLALGDSLLALRGWVRTTVGDSIRWVPRGLASPGPLGYAWKTGPAGVQGWYPDSAGASPGLADTAASIRLAIGDSAAVLRGLIPAVLPTDSIRRLAAGQIPIYGFGRFVGVGDTSATRVFGNDQAGALYSGDNLAAYLAGHANATVVLRYISITHSDDTASTFRRRDTLIACAPDSITAGARVWFVYLPASDAGATNGTGAQIIRVYYVESNAAVGAYAADKFKLPLILGTLASERGMRADHHVRVTLWVEPKIPGRIY